MNTINFIAKHNDQAARLEMLQASARFNFRQSIRALAYANQAAAEGDQKTAAEFRKDAETYSRKSEESFAAVFAAARGL